MRVSQDSAMDLLIVCMQRFRSWSEHLWLLQFILFIVVSNNPGRVAGHDVVHSLICTLQEHAHVSHILIDHMQCLPYNILMMYQSPCPQGREAHFEAICKKDMVSLIIYLFTREISERLYSPKIGLYSVIIEETPTWRSCWGPLAP